MSGQNYLHGWLDQGGHDPLEGKTLAEDALRRMLDMAELADLPPQPFTPSRARGGALDGKARQALHALFGPERLDLNVFNRAQHSLGQSYPDQLQRRSGRASHLAAAIVRPKSAEECLALLQCAAQFRFCVTPAGGNTNVVGAISNDNDKRPWIIADLSLMNRVIDISTINQCVDAEAGILLPELERALNARGLTLGHFPQSYCGASLGGSIACNGAGQRSDLYGRVSDNFISAELATPKGPWKTEGFRHAAAGPWLGGLVPGSEGLFGLICSVKLRVYPTPEIVEDRAFMFPSFESGFDAVRRLAQAGHGLAMLRLSDENETEFLSDFRLAMADRRRPPLWQRAAFAVKRIPARPALLIAGFEGRRTGRAEAFAKAAPVLREAGGIALGRRPGESWRRGRYDLPFLRESLLRRGIGVDTFETSAFWSDLPALRAGVSETLRRIASASLGAKQGRAAVMCHLSHSYAEGACLYFTLLFPQNDSPPAQWRVIKSEVMSAISALGGSVSHHHGAGADHAQIAALEKGSAALEALRALKLALDPENLIVSGAIAMLHATKMAE